jgi:hypothetical protein
VSTSATHKTDGGDGRRSVEVVLAMLRSASPRTGHEIQQLLAAELQCPPTAAEQRIAELSFLSSLLEGPLLDGRDFCDCNRRDYDKVRPTSAPSSRRLVDTYGSWSRACRAAYGLQADGTTTGPGKPWPNPDRGEPRSDVYTREEAIAAVTLCANELRAAGLIGAPTSWQYDEWVRRRKLRAKKRGKTLRLPYARNIYRWFSKRVRGRSRWQTILEAAGLVGRE